jgi:hypothetical protein
VPGSRTCSTNTNRARPGTSKETITALYTTEQRVTGLKQRIAELDRRIAKDWPAA